MMQFCMICLLCASIPGNKYQNGILFGSGEFFGMFFSQFLLTYFDDMKSFYIVAILGQFSYFIFIFFPSVGIHTYIATFTCICSIGAWFNCILLILELRVPPHKVGLTSVITRTMAVGSSVVAPFVVTLPPPYPYAIMSLISILGITVTFYLPPAGLYLPTTKKTG